MPSKTVKLAALVLPFVVLGAMTGYNIMQRNGADPVWQVKITAYDPRDLLHGHYLRYRFDWFADESVSAGEDENCLCLAPSHQGNKDPVVTPMRCDAPQNECVSVIDTPPVENRYFIPEDKAEDLDRMFITRPDAFRIELVAHKDRSISIRELYVDGTELEEFLRYWTPEEDTVE